ncbi:MAG: DUF2057 family protein [Pseudomonadota bacterium]
MRLSSMACIALLALLPAFASAGKAGKVMYAVPAEEKARTDLATLILPEALDIQMVDGFEYAGFKNLFRRGDIEVRILPGEREIAVKYNQLFEWGSNQHEIVRSKVIVLGFVAQPGQVYRAEHDQYRTVEEARKGVENFVVRIVDAQGANQVHGASQVSRNWKGEETVMKRRDLASPDAAVAALAARQAPVAAPAAAPAATPAAPVAAPVPAAVPAAVVAPAAPVAAPVAGGVNALELLKFTWQSASAADRAAFRAWIAAQP